MEREACEVLKALAVGLRLQCADGAWRFVGPRQDPEHSQVPGIIVAELLDGGLIEGLSGAELKITARGDQVVRDAIAAERRSALECLRLTPGIGRQFGCY
jgi:hypothetical protein